MLYPSPIMFAPDSSQTQGARAGSISDPAVEAVFTDDLAILFGYVSRAPHTSVLSS